MCMVDAKGDHRLLSGVELHTHNGGDEQPKDQGGEPESEIQAAWDRANS